MFVQNHANNRRPVPELWKKLVKLRLHNVIDRGLPDEVKKIVNKYGDNPEIMNAAPASRAHHGKHGATNLIRAVNKFTLGREDVIKELLTAPAIDKNAVDYNNHMNTALFAAVKSKDPTVVSLLAECEGVDANVFDEFGKTPLMYAVVDRVVVRQLLASKNIDINIVDHDGRNALHHACMVPAPAKWPPCCINSLLDIKGVKMNERDTAGWTPLMYAAKHGHFLDTLQLLKAGADILMTNKEGKTACQIAEEAGHADIVGIITEQVVKNQQTPSKHPSCLFVAGNIVEGDTVPVENNIVQRLS